ncbi:hypothetical protein [Cryobacterium aureum]|uniref:hypothetical protein n=1 Tax=Cryobacterium aureum TaxID=995037 RepID=UPI00196A1FE1|nr:hypothetical protein [Cryobacterium aureum]
MTYSGGWDNGNAILDWIGETPGHPDTTWREEVTELRAPNGELSRLAVPEHMEIRTLEGKMRADVGDVVIKGIQGEFYPCKPDIFAATYEPADAIREVHAYGRAPVTEITEKA